MLEFRRGGGLEVFVEVGFGAYACVGCWRFYKVFQGLGVWGFESRNLG